MGCLCCCIGDEEPKKKQSDSQTQTEKNGKEKLIDPNDPSNRESKTDDKKIKVKEVDKDEDKEIKNEENEEDEDIKEDQEIKKEEEDNIIKEPNIIKEEMPYEAELKKYLDEKIDDTEVFDKKWYSDIEKDKIIYSKRSIVALLNRFFDPDDAEFKNVYNKPPLVLDINSNGTFITKEFQITRNIYTSKVTDYPKGTTLKMISKYMLNVNERLSWDTGLKSYRIVEGDEKGKEIKCIVHNWMKSPMFLVSERDLLEKRYDFFYEDKFYSYESSVNDDYIPIEKGVTRINDIIFIQQVYVEEDNIIFKACTQMNAKVSLPQAMINMTLAGKLNTFYKSVIDAINKDFKEGKLVFEDNDGNIIEN